jgi:hypothetical protein
MDDTALISKSEDFVDAYKRLVDAASDDDKAGYDRAAATVDRLVFEIGAVAPETMSGLQAKAQAALVLWAGGEADIPLGDKASALARSLIRDLAWMPVFHFEEPCSRPRFTVIEGGLSATQ